MWSSSGPAFRAGRPARRRRSTPRSASPTPTATRRCWTNSQSPRASRSTTASPSNPAGKQRTGDGMATVLQHKVVAALPSPLEPDSIYYVRVGQGFDIHVTNGLGEVVAYGLNAALALQEHIGSGGPAHALATAEAPGFISPAHLQLLDHLGRVNDIGRPGHVGFGVGAAGPDRAAPGRPACGCGAPVEAESPQEERARLPAPPFHRDAPYGSSISLAQRSGSRQFSAI